MKQEMVLSSSSVWPTQMPLHDKHVHCVHTPMFACDVSVFAFYMYIIYLLYTMHNIHKSQYIYIQHVHCGVVGHVYNICICILQLHCIYICQA